MAAFSMLLRFFIKLFAIYFTASNPRKSIDGSIPIIFPNKETKKERKNETPAKVFSCEFCKKKLNNTFFLKNISCGCFWRLTRRNQTAAHYILIEQLLSLNDSLWIILAARQKWTRSNIFHSRPKVKIRKTKWIISFLYSFLKGRVFFLGRCNPTQRIPRLRN